VKSQAKPIVDVELLLVKVRSSVWRSSSTSEAVCCLLSILRPGLLAAPPFSSPQPPSLDHIQQLMDTLHGPSLLLSFSGDLWAPSLDGAWEPSASASPSPSRFHPIGLLSPSSHLLDGFDSISLARPLLDLPDEPAEEHVSSSDVALSDDDLEQDDSQPESFQVESQLFLSQPSSICQAPTSVARR
jgi:hypothetical protein